MIDVRSCNEIRAMMADWFDEDLPSALKARVDEHLAGCDPCRTAFSQMQAMGEDLSLLGHAADRIAATSTRIARRVRFRQQPWVRAAAVVLLIVGGFYLARNRPSIRDQEAMVERTPARQVSRNSPPALNESTIVPDGDCRVSGHTAVAMASANPRVRIVWLYEDAGANVGSTNSSGGPKPRPQG